MDWCGKEFVGRVIDIMDRQAGRQQDDRVQVPGSQTTW